MVQKEQKRKCEICGGSGQLSFLKGVSRFLLSAEECGECAGTGFQLNFTENNNNTVEKKTEEEKE